MSFTDLTKNEQCKCYRINKINCTSAIYLIKSLSYYLVARNHFMQLLIVGNQIPIESSDWSSTNNVGPPVWFDEQKFDLGREYFMKNRFGILNTNLCGLILLLSIPKGLALLRSTKKSSTPETARKRYLDTIMHTMSWYEVQLKNDSKFVHYLTLFSLFLR